MKRYFVAACAAIATVASGSAMAATDNSTTDSALLDAVKGSVSANVAFTTDYRFRGISQTDRDFAIQGGFDYTMNSGFYLGTWASNVDNFNPSPYTGDNGAQAEVDLYGGYDYAINDQWSAGINVLYYYYPGASTAGPNNEIDFWEYTPSVSYTGQSLSATLGVSVSSDYYNESGTSYYPAFDVSTPLTDWLTLAAHVGYQGIEDNDVWGTPDYTDWKIALSTEQFGLNWEVAYIDTDLSDQDCFGGLNTCGATAVGTISKSF
ncbi:TorF family putative porin [Salinisphaera sp. Q1T1-3]|uniref:TorF family putative porin n=1 Tax=Salinisphaera sp. Q1T1-3 TaxID=2321229 RepID=UPI000E72E5C4|nr:TorF family putative porin [Salinisphaera sp. Q1T1-3]RJS91883.1 hypothetical protein D3260_14100 [Salinisphaera sp. Q1T1-3]